MANVIQWTFDVTRDYCGARSARISDLVIIRAGVKRLTIMRIGRIWLHAIRDKHRLWRIAGRWASKLIPIHTCVLRVEPLSLI
jgi:hypothetical protein